MSLHVCPYPGCDARISRSLFACRPHWFALPGSLRSEIWDAFNEGDLDALLAAHGRAHRFYRDHEDARRPAVS